MTSLVFLIFAGSGILKKAKSAQIHEFIGSLSLSFQETHFRV